MCATCETYNTKLRDLLRAEPMFTPQPKPPQAELDHIDYSLGVALVVTGIHMLLPIVGPRPLVNVLADETIQLAMEAVARGEMPVEVMLGLAPSPRLKPIMETHGPITMGSKDLENGAGHDAEDEQIAVV